MKYFFKHHESAYEFQRRLKQQNIDSNLCNELACADDPYSIVLTDPADETAADHIYGVFLLDES